MATHRYKDGYRALSKVDGARRIAFDVLMQVYSEDAYANLALAKALRRARADERLDSRDAGLASELVNGTLRAQGRLDWALSRHLSRPMDELDLEVRVLLRMGAHQILDMRVPDHAAVSTTVDIARHVLTDGPTRMVNAVLRSLTRMAPGELEEALGGIADPIEHAAIAHSHPAWMVREFSRALTAHGYPSDELEPLLAGDNEPPLVTLVARPGLIEADELADEAADVLGTRVAPGSFSEYAVHIEHGDPAALTAIRTGLAGVQDEGSQLAAILLAGAGLTGPDASWLDLCAGPGGKASLLAALAAPRGAALTANEVHPHRARLVERACRAFDNVDVVSADGRTFGGPKTLWPLASFDRIMVDAPCTGMGSMRRRPESRWRRKPEDLQDLLPLQAALAARGAELLRPGGVLAYVTCSPQVDETLGQVERLLDRGDLELLDAVTLAESLVPESLGVPEGAGAVAASKGRVLQLWEHRMGTDLMFISLFRRR